MPTQEDLDFPSLHSFTSSTCTLPTNPRVKPVWGTGLGELLMEEGGGWCSGVFDVFYLYREGEGEIWKEKGEETSMCGCQLCSPLLATWPATQACALTGNQTVILWFTGPRSIHRATSQASFWCFQDKHGIPEQPQGRRGEL